MMAMMFFFLFTKRPTLRRFKTRLIFESNFEQDYNSRAAVLVPTCRALLTSNSLRPALLRSWQTTLEPQKSQNNMWRVSDYDFESTLHPLYSMTRTIKWGSQNFFDQLTLEQSTHFYWMLLIQCSIKNSFVNKRSEKNSSTDENYSSYYPFNPYFVWTSKWWPTKFLWVCYLDLPSLLVILNRQNRNEWVLSDLGNGDSNRLKLKARCTFLVATKIANNCLLHPRSPSISRDPSLQLSLLTVSCRYGASRARGLSWPQQSCYNTFTTLANFQQKSKELDHQSSGHNAATDQIIIWQLKLPPYDHCCVTLQSSSPPLIPLLPY